MLTKTEQVEKAIALGGRLTQAEFEFALERLKKLECKALVTVAYFFPAEAWMEMDNNERRARGADFCRLWSNGEFPELEKRHGTNCVYWSKL